MRIRFGIDDGYAGPAAPHEIDVDDEDLAACETREDQENLVFFEIREWMQCNLHPYCNLDEQDEDLPEPGSL